MRVGIIGTGKHGSRYANHIVHDVVGLELAAVSRRAHEGRDQAAQWNCRWYPDWRELVGDDQVAAVIAVVPPALNRDIALACAEQGKPLLLEKPLAVSSTLAAEIVDLCRTKNLRLTVGQTLRYNPVIQRLRRELPSIGTLCSFSANQRLGPSSLFWHEDPDLAGAGVSFHTAVHVFDALRFITGLEVRRVMAVVRRHRNSALEDLLAVLVEMEQDVVGTLDCSKVGHARSGRYEFVGSKRQLYGDQVHNTLEFIHGTGIKRLDIGKAENTIIPLLRDWQVFLRGEGKNPIPGEEGLAAVRLCEACLESSRTDTWVALQ
jgi:predicted dehydrogenase